MPTPITGDDYEARKLRAEEQGQQLVEARRKAEEQRVKEEREKEIEAIELIIERVLVERVFSQGYVNGFQARRIAIDVVPPSLRGLDSDPSRKIGDTLKLTGGGATGTPDSAYWGRDEVGEVAIGDKVLYKGPFLREYDENGDIVAAGSEINPGPFANQAAYEAALVAAGHTLKPTWDWARQGTDI